MVETMKPYTTYSELDTFGQCALKHFLSYQGGWRKPQPAGSSLSRGSAWHRVMEQHYLHIRDGVGDAQAVIDEIEDEADRELISWMRDGYVELYGEDEADWEILEVEKEYVMPLSDDLDLLGRIDLLVRDKRNKKIYICDHKSRRNFSSRADIELDDQFALYTWLLRQAGVPVFGFIRSDARTQRNKGPMKLDQRFQRESVYYTDKYLESVAAEKLQVVKAMQSGIVYASVSPDLCSWRCDFKEAHMTARAIGKPVDLVVQGFGFTQREGVQ